ncbi:hypothetical protein HN807_06640 [Candidatus Bathyarchaeota archaeon]|nr:hypothetical protein [Candidatus Bathyarchaeota archaeon]MBT7915406.1 hypothetical protein [Candidatus Bathyarchaeota archaeon]
MSLKDWLERWDKNESQDRLSQVHEKLINRYSDTHRHYHNIDHIAACLNEFNEVEHLLQNPVEVWLAVWFHDVVYDPKAHDNEERSVDYAEKALREIIGEVTLENISRLIMATKHYRPASDHDSKFIQDIDLTILGGHRDIFDEYEERIRREYSWVPENRFRKGRADILSGFIERSTIYQTKYFRKKYEETARANLYYSISKLKKGI